MSAPPLPDFQHATQLSQGSLDVAELAECHGVLCGLLCRESAGTANDYMHHLAALKLVVNPGDALDAVLGEVFECTVKQLADEDMGFALWLPEDDEPLEERTIALARSGVPDSWLAWLAEAGSRCCPMRPRRRSMTCNKLPLPS